MNLDYQLLDLRTRHEFHIARAAAPTARRSVWLRVHDGDGAEGWGEAAPNAYYGESADTVVACIPALRNVLAAEEDPLALERIEAAVEQAVGYAPAARAAVSAALHDLVGRKLGVPVWRLWGLDPAAAPLSSLTIGIDEPERMREKLREAAGYPIIKVKIGTPDDERILRLIRDEAPAATLRVDANTGWSADRALALLPVLEEYRVELIEQPFPPDDLESFRRLRRHARIPVVADESCKTAADIPRVLGLVDGINIKLAKCGSLREALRMVHTARAHGLAVMLGCMIESTLGIAAALQLAALVDYADLDGAALLADDPFRGPGLEPDGRLRFNEEPGLGVRSPTPPPAPPLQPPPRPPPPSRPPGRCPGPSARSP